MRCALFLGLFSMLFACKLTIVGGGVGGLYTAFRLVNDSVYKAKDICIFEKTGRVGGRIHSVRNVFPTASSVDPGAHAFRDPEHPIMMSLVYNVLKLNTGCFSKTLDCTTSNEGDLYSLRNNYTGNLETSADLPYNFDENEEWVDGDSPDPIFELLDLYPFVYDEFENLLSTNNSVRWPAIARTLNIARTYSINGMYPNQYTIRSLLNHSSEFWQWWVDTQGEALSTLPEVNVYDALRNIVYYALGSIDESHKKVIVDSLGHEIGYSTIPENLASMLENMGATITYNKEVSGVYMNGNGNGNIKVSFADGSTINSKKLILNIPSKDVMKLSHDSIIFSNSSVNNLYELFAPVCAVKGYFYYPESWWLPIFNNEMSVTNELRYYEYLDSNSDGPTTGNNTGGFVNIVYADGLDYCRYFQSAQLDKSNPIVIIHSNTTNAIEKKIFVDMVKLLSVAQKKVLEDANITSIPEPEILVMGVWDVAWHQIPSSDYLGGHPSQMMIQPLVNLPIYFVNEAYSVDQGWAEGSLIAGEKVAVKLGACGRPSWLGNAPWYQTVITNFI